MTDLDPGRQWNEQFYRSRQQLATARYQTIKQSTKTLLASTGIISYNWIAQIARWVQEKHPCHNRS
jgi:hypothetical protein